MHLPELAERDAAGEQAAIYAEMKRLGGVPMVATIFRHLATRPGVLEWAWGAVGPAWRSGILQETAWRIASEVPVEPIAPMPLAALASLGVDAGALAEIRRVLEAYNRANPENMLSMLCLLRLLEGHRATVPLAAHPWAPPPSPGPLVPMVDVATMGKDLTELLDLVAAPGGTQGPRVVQGLYRHLARRPAFLALAVTLLRARFDDGAIGRATAAITARMNEAADRLAESLVAPPVPDFGVRGVVERFSGAVIPQMIVVGRLLEEALP